MASGRSVSKYPYGQKIGPGGRIPCSGARILEFRILEFSDAAHPSFSGRSCGLLVVTAWVEKEVVPARIPRERPSILVTRRPRAVRRVPPGM